MTPASQRLSEDRELRPSSFVRRCLPALKLAPDSEILDLPCGTGRHSLYFGGCGHTVTVVDIDETLVRVTEKRLWASGMRCRGIVADATQSLPFHGGSFDLAVVVDFVDEHLLATIGALIRVGGHLIHESYPAKGGDWRQLLRPGHTEHLLAPMFEIVGIQKSGAGPSGTEGETIKVLARRR